MPATVSVPLASFAAGWNAVRFPAPSRTAKPSCTPAPPTIVPATLPPGWKTKASLEPSWPVRFSNPTNAVPSTLPALAPVTVQAVWSLSAAGPISVSAPELPTTLVTFANAGSEVALASCRSTLTAELRGEKSRLLTVGAVSSTTPPSSTPVSEPEA